MGNVVLNPSAGETTRESRVPLGKRGVVGVTVNPEWWGTVPPSRAPLASASPSVITVSTETETRHQALPLSPEEVEQVAGWASDWATNQFGGAEATSRFTIGEDGEKFLVVEVSVPHRDLDEMLAAEDHLVEAIDAEFSPDGFLENVVVRLTRRAE